MTMHGAATEAVEPIGEEVNASDAAKRRAKELGMDLSAVEGSAFFRRAIIVKDIESAAKQQEKRRFSTKR